MRLMCSNFAKPSHLIGRAGGATASEDSEAVARRNFKSGSSRATQPL